MTISVSCWIPLPGETSPLFQNMYACGGYDINTSYNNDSLEINTSSNKDSLDKSNKGDLINKIGKTAVENASKIIDGIWEQTDIDFVFVDTVKAWLIDHALPTLRATVTGTI